MAAARNLHAAPFNRGGRLSLWTGPPKRHDVFFPPGPGAFLGALYGGIWRFAEGARLARLGAAALLTASQALRLAVPWLAAQAINALQQGGAGAPARAALWVGAIGLVSIATWALHGPGRILERNVGVRVRSGVADALYARHCDRRAESRY